MKFHPLRNLVLLRPIPASKTAKHGIIIPDSVTGKDQLVKATVVKIGVKVESDISIGDTVLYFQSAGDEVFEDGETLIVCNEDFIEAKIW